MISIKEENDLLIERRFQFHFEFLPVLSINEINIPLLYDIKARALVLSVVIQVAFKLMSNEDALCYIQENNLFHLMTLKEISFFQGVTKDRMIYETWKSECLYTLLWYLGVEINLEEVIEQADLNNIDSSVYPFLGLAKSPNRFLENASFTPRDLNDLVRMYAYFSRLDYICDWHKLNMKKCEINSALVYERRYALTWLLTGANWDNIQCNSIL